jgi:hypothetical protein
MDEIDIEVRGEGDAILVSGRFRLPVVLGRGEAATVRFDADRQVLSRRHAEIALNGSVLTVRDLNSQIGTRYHGRLLAPDLPVQLNSQDTIEIGHFAIRIRHVGAAADTAKATLCALVSKGPGLEHHFDLGPTMLVLIETAGRVSAASVPTTHPDEARAACIANGQRLTACISARGKQAELTVMSDPAGVAVTVNRGKPQGERIALKPLDVVQIGKVRIEIHEPNDKFLQCKNGACQMLNPYVPTENCRWCGHALWEHYSRTV